MEIYLIPCLLLVLVLFGIVFWITKIAKFYKQNRRKIAIINAIILVVLTLVVLWELRIIPLSADLDFRNQTKGLTGKQFWCWNDYRYEEGGVRGEGFTFEIYKLNDEMVKYFEHPDKDFFESFPAEKFETTKWKETPILDTDLVKYVTPIYGNWPPNLQKEIEEKQKILRQISREKGSYYAIKRSNETDLYLISPKLKLIVYINHNM